MPVYKQNNELEELAAQVIKERRPELSMLSICYLFRGEAAVSNDKVVAGMCIKVDDRNWTIHKHDFLIEIAKDVWDEASDLFRDAIMDHELGHCGIRMEGPNEPRIDEKTGRLRVYIIPHDIEEFADVLERHGDYHAALREFLNSFVEFKKKAKEAQGSDAGGTTGGNMDPFEEIDEDNNEALA